MTRFVNPPEENAVATGSAGESSPRNGEVPGADAGKPAASEASPGTAESKATLDRAQVLADNLGAKIAEFTVTWGWKLLKMGAVVRESVEDMWAEAQNIRRGKRS
jgi:hypothetical protein